jgi:ribonuclease HI
MWNKEDVELTKLNVDASFSEENGNGSWGAILRVEEGKAIMSSLHYCPET